MHLASKNFIPTSLSSEVVTSSVEISLMDVIANSSPPSFFISSALVFSRCLESEDLANSGEFLIDVSSFFWIMVWLRWF